MFRFTGLPKVISGAIGREEHGHWRISEIDWKSNMIQQLALALIKIDPSWCSWFSGFLDGEGYFQIAWDKRDNTTRCALTVTLREDDKDIIDEIREKLMCGRVFYIAYNHARNNGSHSCNQWRWVVRNVDHCINTIIPLLDRYPLRTKKARDYEIWRKAAFLAHSIKHICHTKKERQELMNLYTQLRTLHMSPFTEKGYKAIDNL
jgi:hypothetical protein